MWHARGSTVAERWSSTRRCHPRWAETLTCSGQKSAGDGTGAAFGGPTATKGSYVIVAPGAED